jgi:PAS domain S-box-containing protein
VDDGLRENDTRLLRAREEGFQQLSNTVPVMIWMTGLDKLCTYVNRQWIEFTGRSLETELGIGWTESLHPDDVQHCLDIYTAAFDRREPLQVEYRLRRHDGEYRWILDSGAPRFNEQGTFEGYIGSAIDITALKVAEEALSSVSQRLIKAQEEERRRLGRELHDDISQRLSLLSWRIDSLKRDLPPASETLRSSVEAARKDAVALAADVQALSHRLHSSRLELLGLEAAATDFCEELAERHNVDIEFRAANVPKASAEISLCLFRVLQEALLNAIKHSGSARIAAVIEGTEGAIELAVRDWGKGLEREHAIRNRGLGLTSMKERLKLVGGRLAIESTPGGGTTVRARVPIV